MKGISHVKDLPTCIEGLIKPAALCAIVMWLTAGVVQANGVAMKTWPWAIADGHNLSLAGMGVDTNGNVYVTGNRFGSTYFGGIPLAAQFGGVFLCKYDANGKLLWPKWAIQGNGHPQVLNAVVTPGGEVVIVAYSSTGNITVDKIVLPNDRPTTLVAKFDLNGQALWTRLVSSTNNSYSSSGHTQPNALALDSQGNTYLLGHFSGTLVFGNSTLESGYNDFPGFMAKLDADGNPLWAIHSTNASSIAVEPSGNVYLAGVNHSSSPPYKAHLFLNKYTPEGLRLWTFRTTEGEGIFEPKVTADADGGCFFAGAVRGEVGLGSWSISSGSKDFAKSFLARFDASGYPLWAQVAGGQFVRAIAADRFNRVFTFGQISGSEQFGAVTLTNTAPQGSSFIEVHDAAGSFRSVTQIAASEQAAVSGIDFGPDGAPYLAGVFQGSGNFGGHVLDTTYWGTMFLGKLAPEDVGLLPAITTQPKNQVAFARGAAGFVVAAEGEPPLRYQWQQDGVDLPGATNSTLVVTNAAVPGLTQYRVVIQNALGSVTSDQAALSVNQRLNDVHVTTVAGDGTPGFRDSVSALSQFRSPARLHVGTDGSIYVADTGNHRIRKVDPANSSSTLAGSGAAGFGDGLAHLAQFDSPGGVCLDRTGRVWIADTGNHRIRVILPGQPALVNTIAGDGVQGYADGPAASAQFDSPTDLVLDSHGNVFICEPANHVIRKLTSADVVTTFVGDGTAGSTDGVGGNARLDRPSALAVDTNDNLYIAEGAGRVRQVTPAGLVTTVAGTGTAGFLDGPGSSARFNNPQDLAVDSTGNLFVVEGRNHSVRRIGPDRFVSTVAGDGQPWFRDGDNSVARFNRPSGLGVDGNNILVIADTENHRIRKIGLGAAPKLIARPVDQMLSPGGRLVLSVTPSGEPPFEFQWLLDGRELPGQTNATLVNATVTPNALGEYTVRVQNAHGATESLPVRVSFAADKVPVPDYEWGVSIPRDPSTMSVLTDPEGNCIVLADELFKLNPAGQRLWSLPQARYQGMTLDGEGNVYAVLPKEQTGRTISSLMKIKPNGTNLWEKEFDRYLPGSLSANHAGYLYYSMDWTKYDPEGELVWARPGSFLASSTDLLAPDRLERIYATQSGGQYMFLHQFDADGNLRWRRLFAGIGGWGTASLTGLAVDPRGEVYLSGWIYGTFVFGVHPVTAARESDFFLVRCDRAGNVYWARQSGLENAFIHGMAVSQDGVYVTGTLKGPGSFAGTPVPEEPQGTFFVAKYNPEGEVVWARIEGPGSVGKSVAVDAQENVYVAGRLWGPNPFEVEWRSENPWSYAGPSFVLKLRSPHPQQAPVIVGNPRSYLSQRGSNVTLSVIVSRGSTDGFQWQHNGIDLSGATNRTLTLSALEAVDAGEYSVVVRNRAGSTASSVATVELGASESFVTRKLPAFYAPETPFEIKLTSIPPATSALHWVEERLPLDWSVSQAGPSGFYDPPRRTIMFGPFLDRRARHLTYQAVPPRQQAGWLKFEGRGVLDGRVTPVLGATTTEMALFHPADLGDDAYSLSWAEVTGYAEAWRNGHPWEAEPSVIPIEYLTAAGKIWTMGSVYSPSDTGLPAAWIPMGRPSGAESNAATLFLPETFIPGEPFDVEIVLEPAEQVGCCAAELGVPMGWRVTDVGRSGALDATAGIVRWGPFFGNATQRLNCTVTAEGTISTTPEFGGAASCDGMRIDYLGRRSLSLPSQLTARIVGEELQVMLWQQPGQDLEFFSSADLVRWERLGTVTSSTGLYIWSEPAQSSVRFYRVSRNGPNVGRQ